MDARVLESTGNDCSPGVSTGLENRALSRIWHPEC
jgi:hypothetical protein